jgi:hypothetical protein
MSKKPLKHQTQKNQIQQEFVKQIDNLSFCKGFVMVNEKNPFYEVNEK